MNADRAHTVIGSVALVLMAVGAGVSWGWGYGLLLVGVVLLVGVIYARTRL